MAEKAHPSGPEGRSLGEISMPGMNPRPTAPKTRARPEPKNRRMTIEQIQSGRIKLHPSRIQIRRAQELIWARPIIESPTMIVPNRQAMGRAIPGDA